ncbi:MAG: hypothetical protein WD423_04690 [Rhodothermales bacterium]
MKEEDEPKDTAYLSSLSLHKLGAYAMEEELIEGIEIRDDVVTIVQGDNRFVLPPKQAATFLVGMLRGRSWFIQPGDPEGRPAEPGSDPSEPGEDPAEPGRDPEHAADEPGGGQGVHNQSLERTLDSLLAFAQDAGILDGYEKDAETQTVRIDIPACSTTLSYIDALGYLLDCIQYELRAYREEE